MRLDRAADRAQARVERAVNRPTRHRAIATRREKLEGTLQALLTIAAILLWLPV